MSRFFSDTYKWSLYEKYRNGFTLTELCEISGITDKPLRNWFRYIDSQYAQSAQLSVKSAQQKNTHLRQTVTLRQTELNLLSKIIAEIPESQRVSSAHLLLSTYGPNQVCCSLGIRKSNLYYITGFSTGQRLLFMKSMIKNSVLQSEKFVIGISNVLAQKISVNSY